MSATFLARVQPFSCFSRAIAAFTSGVGSQYTNWLSLYLVENSPNPSRCSANRRSISFVMPVYKTVYCWLVRT